MSEEVRKFFRYVLPGLVFIIETSLFSYIVLPDQTACFLYDHLKELGPVVSIFLVSGGLGFIFASVHHWVSWYLPFFDAGIFDHRELVIKLEKSKLILLEQKDLDMVRLGTDCCEKSIKNTLLKAICCNTEKAKMKAWAISQSLWYRFLKSKQSGKEQINHLGHQAQGLGATRIASCFAFVTTLYVWRSVELDNALSYSYPLLRYIAMCVIGIVSIWMFHGGYRRVATLAHDAYAITLIDELEKNNRLSPAPRIISLSYETD